MEAYRIRLARADELTLLQRIEDDAGRLFGTVGIRSDLPGLPLGVLEEGQHAERLWVVTGPDDQAVGFALCWAFPGALHLREIDVHPEHGRRGLGGRLIKHVARETARRGLARLTLTTFADVPWNAPYYERHGFLRLPDDALPDWLAAIRREEIAAGLDRWPRVAMAQLIPSLPALP